MRDKKNDWAYRKAIRFYALIANGFATRQNDEPVIRKISAEIRKMQKVTR